MSNTIIETSGGMKDLSTPRGAGYFLAMQAREVAPRFQGFLRDDWLLIALNYFIRENGEVSDDILRDVRSMAVDHRHRIYMDSGCFSLAFEHAKHIGSTPQEVFMSDPNDLPFFEGWMDIYCNVIPSIIDWLWGVVEIDFGNAEQRAETRQQIFERTGVRAIPVFRARAEDPEVFINLITTHDRVCLAGTSKIPSQTRHREMGRFWELWQRHAPDCFVHVLGQSPCGAFTAFPFSSCDSSTFATTVRWGHPYGYTLPGVCTKEEWTPRAPKGESDWRYEHGGKGILIRGMGMLQHSVYNVARREHLDEAYSSGHFPLTIEEAEA